MGFDNGLNLPDVNLDSYSALMQILKENIMIGLNVCIPATVVSYDRNNNTVKLQPAIQTVIIDEGFVDMPLLLNVPVLELGGAGLSIKIPLQAGDTGIVIFCDKDITLFKQEKKNTQPNTLRKHDLSDGIFIPMKFGNAGANNNISIESADGNTKFEVTSSGIAVKGNITVEGDVIAGGISLKEHLHSAGTYSNSAGSVTGTSGNPQ
mgnify:CR=1 FL=1